MAKRKHVSLVANTAQNVTLLGEGNVRVVNHGVDPVYFRFDGTTVVGLADDTYCCLPGGFRAVGNQDRDGTVIVSCISAGTPDVTVELIDDRETYG